MSVIVSKERAEVKAKDKAKEPKSKEKKAE